MAQPWGLLLLLAAALATLMLWGGIMTALQALKPSRKSFAWALATGRPKDPGDLGWTFDEIECSSGQTHTCPAWRIQGGSQNANAPVLVMIHGWGRSRWDSLARAQAFAPWCSEMVLLDLPGHGDHLSALCTVGIHEPQCVAHALHNITHNANTPVILVGHSMGAGIAIRAANIAAREAANTFAPAHFAAQSLNKNLAKTAQTKGIQIAGVIALAPYSTLRSPIPARLALKQLPVWPFAPIAFLALRLLNRMDRALEIDAHALSAPLLVMAGDHDPISPLKDARAIAAAANGTLVVVPYQRHDDLRAGAPDTFDYALETFFKQVTAG